MNILQNVDLKEHSTMRLGGMARYFSVAGSERDVFEAVQWAKSQNAPFIVIGRGSNIIWRDEGFPGLVIANCIKGRGIVHEDEHSATIRAAGGENWDELVAWTVEKNLTGIEFLSLIPGTVGAAPVQNIGAYGAEIADTLIELSAIDTLSHELVKIPKVDCGFKYRSSRFKTTDRGHFIITSVTLRLKKGNPEAPFYEVLQSYFDEHGINSFTPAVVRQAVIAIRQAKLPDPEKVPNNGSFFTNPYVTAQQFEALRLKHPDIKGWPGPDGRVKVAAGWLVEQAGFRGVHDAETGMATSEAQALVLINEHARTTADLLAFKQKIVAKVEGMFGIRLEQEPELLP